MRTPVGDFHASGGKQKDRFRAGRQRLRGALVIFFFRRIKPDSQVRAQTIPVLGKRCG
jgi:hypothetical protein